MSSTPPKPYNPGQNGTYMSKFNICKATKRHPALVICELTSAIVARFCRPVDDYNPNYYNEEGYLLPECMNNDYK